MGEIVEVVLGEVPEEEEKAPGEQTTQETLEGKTLEEEAPGKEALEEEVPVRMVAQMRVAVEAEDLKGAPECKASGTSSGHSHYEDPSGLSVSDDSRLFSRQIAGLATASPRKNNVCVLSHSTTTLNAKRHNLQKPQVKYSSHQRP